MPFEMDTNIYSIGFQNRWTESNTIEENMMITSVV